MAICNELPSKAFAGPYSFSYPQCNQIHKITFRSRVCGSHSFIQFSIYVFICKIIIDLRRITQLRIYLILISFIFIVFFIMSFFVDSHPQFVKISAEDHFRHNPRQ